MNDAWHLWPAVLQERVAGVVARRADQPDAKLLEIFSNVAIAPLLKLEPGARVAIRVLPGALLPPSV